MIHREKILAALTDRQSEFLTFEQGRRTQFELYRHHLDQLSNLPQDQLREQLSLSASPGAVPVEAFLPDTAFIVPFPHPFHHREEARQWAYETLLGRTTFAADGSQILPSKDYSLPVAAVQVGWFENPHQPGVPYAKDLAFEILTPAEVMVRTGSDTEFSEQIVHRQRYRMECEALKRLMRAAAQRGFTADKPPVAFFDSLLIISFAELLPPEQREFYVAEIVALLDTSRQTGIPLVGYVDTSLARDLVNLLQTVFALEDSPQISDAPLLATRLKWGDRTTLFRSARRGILEDYGERWRREIGFIYLQTSSDAPPSRLDLPMWVYEQGLLDYLVDTVRGEIIVGNGYPYVIESADQTAVLTTRDREVFYATFQEFAKRAGLHLHIARKAISKAQRR